MGECQQKHPDSCNPPTMIMLDLQHEGYVRRFKLSEYKMGSTQIETVIRQVNSFAICVPGRFVCDPFPDKKDRLPLFQRSLGVVFFDAALMRSVF